MNSNKTVELLFRTGVISLSAESRSTESVIERIVELGLGCNEILRLTIIKLLYSDT
jgi:hypothetical protein